MCRYNGQMIGNHWILPISSLCLNAVIPFFILWLMFAPLFIRSSTIFSPEFSCNGCVKCFRKASWTFFFEKLSDNSMVDTTARTTWLPLDTAKNIGVAPMLSSLFTSHPYLIKSSATFSLPSNFEIYNNLYLFVCFNDTDYWKQHYGTECFHHSISYWYQPHF